MGVRIQPQALDCTALHERLRTRSGGLGALVTFTGYVRDFNPTGDVSELFLEHYPGMTEKLLRRIVDAARQRWPLLGVELVHRIGALGPGEPIVFVGVASHHRHAAFEACACIMDQLKTRAPLWKREHLASGPSWVEPRESDQQAVLRW